MCIIKVQVRTFLVYPNCGHKPIDRDDSYASDPYQHSDTNCILPPFEIAVITHKLPSMKIPASAIFCDNVRWSLKITVGE